MEEAQALDSLEVEEGPEAAGEEAASYTSDSEAASLAGGYSSTPPPALVPSSSSDSPTRGRAETGASHSSTQTDSSSSSRASQTSPIPLDELLDIEEMQRLQLQLRLLQPLGPERFRLASDDSGWSTPSSTSMRDVAATSSGQEGTRRGKDWRCPSCGKHQFARNASCRTPSCLGERPVQRPPRPAPSQDAANAALSRLGGQIWMRHVHAQWLGHRLSYEIQCMTAEGEREAEAVVTQSTWTSCIAEPAQSSAQTDPDGAAHSI